MTTELLPFFIGCTVRASLLLGFVWGLTALLRRASASTRHFLWACAIVAAALVPLMIVMLPPWQLPSPAPFAPVALVVTHSVPDAIASEPRDSRAISRPTSEPMSLDRHVTPASPLTTAQSDQLPHTGIVATVWIIGTTAVLLYTVLGFVAAWRLRRLATQFETSWTDTAQTLATDLEIRGVAFVESPTAAMPVVCGLWRPTIVLPRDARTWPQERLRIVVLHELAHVRRRDALTQAVAQLVCAGYWFNPLVWIAARCLRAERERACDDAVLTTGTKGSEYARHLVEIARAMEPRWLPASVGLPMAYRSQLEERLKAILDPQVSRSPTRCGRVAVMAAVVLMSIPITAVELGPPTVVRRQVPGTSDAHASAFPTIRSVAVPPAVAGSWSDNLAGDSIATAKRPITGVIHMQEDQQDSRTHSGLRLLGGARAGRTTRVGSLNTIAIQRPSQAHSFQWTGTLNEGETLEVRGLYGSIRTIPSNNGLIQIDARTDDSARDRIDVVQRDTGITICSVVSTPQGDQSACQPGRRAASAQLIDDRVDFVVQIPAGVRFAGSMIRGDIEISRVRADVNVATVEGDIALRLAPGDGVEFRANVITGSIDADFPIYDSTPVLPSGDRPGGPGAPRIVHTIIGGGGLALVATTVNGDIHLRRR
ncbi:MAG TPA: M56 family metallopeptidase [Blastocatellia bacterium]|nr:M56 family metallopeptidase [Blastocatellia bacterium]